MRVLVNSLRDLSGGNRRYLVDLIDELSNVPNITLSILATTKMKIQKDNVNIIYYKPSKNIYANILKERYIIKSEVSKNSYDIFHSPNTLLPIFRPRIPTVITVHDLNFKNFSFGIVKNIYKNLIYSYSLKTADVVIAVSEFTKREIQKYYPRVKKVVVIGEGVNSKFLASRFTEQLNTLKPFLLTFGHQMHKNVEDAMVILKKVNERGYKVRLRIIGNNKKYSKKIMEFAKKIDVCNLIEMLGYVSDEELIKLYSTATALVFLSKYEGFGLPVIEAAALGCPVLVSDRGALPYTGKGFAKIISLENLDEGVEYIIRLLEDDDFSKKERVKCVVESKKYKWDRIIYQIYEVYENLLSRRIY